ncbi:ATP-binding cassette domain-containing protein [Aequorivita sp. H23M31]|uniref:ATP-binding cassette domain-containing protein n=1 Tax=Aequorivita ciconiae TaxID=2494375 RepID=A0A410G506_9FLAO|nr:ATP-binding cassette domain-containing protein [Aequorivita sp. H23M31]QAA82295.1 ATP-binding cassette domain-containing protein [Aequorivita sp. H23M31]
MDMKQYVQIDSLTKGINNKSTLSGIHMTINQGEIIGLFGRNGSGKSTLMSILFGVTRADNICLIHNGKIILNRNNFHKIFSHLPQFNYLPQNVTVRTLIWLVVKKKNI